VSEWRAGTWATLFGGGFLAGATMIVTWLAVSDSAAHPLPFWPIYLFIVLEVVGVAGFLIAIFRPDKLPGYVLSEREEERREDRRHTGELELDRKKDEASAFRRFLDPFGMHADRGQDEHTRALENHASASRELAEEMRLRRLREEQRGSDDPTP
jgi:hypothetical protein